MVNRINRIITEAINNTIVFNQLSKHVTDLQWYTKQLKSNNNASQFNGEIIQFNNELILFVESLINAINRCIQAQSLNESSEGWLSNTPSLNKLYNAIVNGYNVNRINDIISAYNRIRGAQYGGSRNSYKVNNQPKNNEKLQVILTQYFPLIQQKYIKLNTKYNNALGNMNPPTAKYILDEVEEVIYTIKNAQGQNP